MKIAELLISSSPVLWSFLIPKISSQTSLRQVVRTSLAPFARGHTP